ncbi:MAG: translation elongation factor Ts [bacterium]|nr:translation elongation factor Ts [bacterium]
MALNLEDIKQLRERTGAGVVDAKTALEESAGDVEKAILVLRKKGVAKAAKKAGRVAAQGIIETYVHGGRVGVLLELNSETDFVARNEKFKELAHELTLQIAATDPKVIDPSEVTEEMLAAEREVGEAALKDKPQKIKAAALEGKLKKFAEQQALLTQPSIKNPDELIKDMLTRYIALIGENIQIRRFARFELGRD